jgi:hypothetical protein
LYGALLVEPAGVGIADGPAPSADEADFELQPTWRTSSPQAMREARRLLGLANPPRPG